MMWTNLLSYLSPQTLFKTTSEVNGEIKVIKLYGENSIFTGNVIQAGPPIKKIGNEIARYLKKSKENTNNILVLGLGGGTIINVLKKYFPQSKITAVEIDQKIIEIYEKYFKDKKSQNIKIIKEDANKFIEENNKIGIKDYYDAIIIDIYANENIPAFVSENIFLNLSRQLLSNDGTVVFNRIKDLNKISEADIFLDKTREIYHDIYVKEVRISQIAKNSLIFCRK